MKTDKRQIRREGTLRKELHDQRREGLAPRADNWGGRPTIRDERRTARRNVKRLLREVG